MGKVIIEEPLASQIKREADAQGVKQVPVVITHKSVEQESSAQMW